MHDQRVSVSPSPMSWCLCQSIFDSFLSISRTSQLLCTETFLDNDHRDGKVLGALLNKYFIKDLDQVEPNIGTTFYSYYSNFLCQYVDNDFCVIQLRNLVWLSFLLYLMTINNLLFQIGVWISSIRKRDRVYFSIWDLSSRIPSHL